MKRAKDRGCVEHVSLRERVLLWLVPLAGALIALNSVMVFAATERAGFEEPDLYSPPSQARWGFVYENDFLVPGGNDRDYTFGLALSYSSKNFRSNSHLGDKMFTPLTFLDRLLGFRSTASRNGLEAGLYGFTPADKTQRQVNTDDRPFSSLVYFASSNERVDAARQSVVRSQLTLGVLGLSLVGQLQDSFHDAIGNERPQGWDNQISNGGEFTARYAVSKQRLLPLSSRHFELRETRTASVGYLTEASWGLSFRVGKLNSRWHEFNPDLASYAESAASVNRGTSEHFFWAGVAVKARAYNAFLQGQFRDSVHRFGGEELKHGVIELWAGYTHSFTSGYFVSYGLRGHSSELDEGVADRNVVWGGLMLGKKII